jgi:hypothetical protein
MTRVEKLKMKYIESSIGLSGDGQNTSELITTRDASDSSITRTAREPPNYSTYFKTLDPREKKVSISDARSQISPIHNMRPPYDISDNIPTQNAPFTTMTAASIGIVSSSDSNVTPNNVTSNNVTSNNVTSNNVTSHTTSILPNAITSTALNMPSVHDTSSDNITPSHSASDNIMSSSTENTEPTDQVVIDMPAT